MHITIITPAEKHAKVGNRISAQRWRKLFQSDKHKVCIKTQYDNSATDLMIALHAWRSAKSICKYKKKYPNGPLIVVIGGTDANTFLNTDPDTTIQSLKAADAIVCLHKLIGELLPFYLRQKLYFIPQSALPAPTPKKMSSRNFNICVIASLRKEKDPLRTALATKLLPESSKIKVTHFGKSISSELQKLAKDETHYNPRYFWRGEVPQWRVRREYQKSRLMVVSSLQEGGANVVSEAIASEIPILASKISGNVGLLGEKYPGYFPVRDENALSHLMSLAETQKVYLESLLHHLKGLKGLFLPRNERRLWKDLIIRITSSK